MPSNVDLPQPDGPIRTTVAVGDVELDAVEGFDRAVTVRDLLQCSGIGRPISGSHCYQNRAVGHLLAFADGDRFDLRVEGGLELVLDLHRPRARSGVWPRVTLSPATTLMATMRPSIGARSLPSLPASAVAGGA